MPDFYEDDDEKNQCKWCRGCGFIIEDKTEYFYYGSEMMRRAHNAKDEKKKQEIYEQLDKMKTAPMQPYAIVCPKCGGTGRRNNEQNDK